MAGASIGLDFVSHFEDRLEWPRVAVGRRYFNKKPGVWLIATTSDTENVPQSGFWGWVWCNYLRLCIQPEHPTRLQLQPGATK